MNLFPVFLIALLPSMVASQSSQSSQSSSVPGTNAFPTNLPTHTIVIVSTSTSTDFFTTTTVTPGASGLVSGGTADPMVLTASVTSLSTVISTSCEERGINCDTSTSFTTVLNFSLITITTRAVTAVVTITSPTITTSTFSQIVQDGTTTTSWFTETIVASSPTLTTETWIIDNSCTTECDVYSTVGQLPSAAPSSTTSSSSSSSSTGPPRPTVTATKKVTNVVTIVISVVVSVLILLLVLGFLLFWWHGKGHLSSDSHDNESAMGNHSILNWIRRVQHPGAHSVNGTQRAPTIVSEPPAPQIPIKSPRRPTPRPGRPPRPPTIDSATWQSIRNIPTSLRIATGRGSVLDVPVSDGENIAMQEVEVPEQVVQPWPPYNRQFTPEPSHLYRGSPWPPTSQRVDFNIGFGRSNTFSSSTPRPVRTRTMNSDPQSMYDRTSGIGKPYGSGTGPSRYEFIDDEIPDLVPDMRQRDTREINREDALATLEGRKPIASSIYSTHEEEPRNIL